MKRLLTLVAFFATLQASAQQVNPVPDYVFRNQMSVGRGTVTDTAAYFSIGPRYGANKGFMPPIVVDTATFSSGKRNGLLIFSVQKNKFLYWDSVRVQWSDMAGSSGSYITGTLTSNYLPKATGSTTIGNSQIFDNGTNIGIGTTTPNGKLHLRGVTDIYMNIENTTSNNNLFLSNVNGEGRLIISGFNPLSFYANGIEQFRVNANGNFGIGTNAPTDRLHVSGRARFTTIDSTSSPINVLTSNVDGVVRKTSLSAIANAGIDTTTISTRAWRQKGLDSLAALEVSGSGTTNYVAKFTAGSTIGNSQIFDNGTNVGIGTTTAGAKLEVNLASGVNIITARGPEYAQVRHTDGVRTFFTQVYDNVGFMGMESNTPLAIGTNNTERLRITSGGDVGIGTSSPMTYTNYRNLSIQGQSTGAVIDMATSAGLTAGGLQIAVRATDTDISAFGPQSGTASFLSFRTGTYAAVAERMRIFGNGRIGINTTTDAGYQLDVNGTLRTVNGVVLASGSGNIGLGVTSSPWSFSGNIDLGNDNNLFGGNVAFGFGMNAYYDGAWKYKGTGNASYIKQENGTFQFYTSSSGTAGNTITFTRPMTLTQSAELIINSITDAGDYKLQVSGNVYSTGSYTSGAPSGGTARPWKLGSVVATSVILDTSNYVEVEINGVAYKLALVTPN